MAGKSALSDWELDELVHYAHCGWTLFELSSHYGVSERSVQRILRRMEKGAARTTQETILEGAATCLPTIP